MLLLATIVLAIFPLMFAGRKNLNKSDLKQEAAYYTRQAAEQMKAFVNGVDSGGMPTPIPEGPNQGAGSYAKEWIFPNDTRSAPGDDALIAGDHDITNNLPASRFKDHNGTLKYRVDEVDCGGVCDPNVAAKRKFCCKKVTFTANWIEEK